MERLTLVWWNKVVHRYCHPIIANQSKKKMKKYICDLIVCIFIKIVYITSLLLCSRKMENSLKKIVAVLLSLQHKHYDQLIIWLSLISLFLLITPTPPTTQNVTTAEFAPLYNQWQLPSPSLAITELSPKLSSPTSNSASRWCANQREVLCAIIWPCSSTPEGVFWMTPENKRTQWST